MSCFTGVSGSGREASRVTREIDRSIIQQRDLIENTFKMVVLGLKGAGVSTIVRQTKVVFLSGFTSEERAQFSRCIQEYTVYTMNKLLDVSQSEKVEISDSAKTFALQALSARDELLSSDKCFNEQFVESFSSLWKECSIRSTQRVLKCALITEGSFEGSMAYFLENYQRICSRDYSPTEQDILQLPHRQSFTTTQFLLNRREWRITNSSIHLESKSHKWLQLFDGVDTLTFVVALDSFDEFEDGQNKLHQALDMIEFVTNQQQFRHHTVAVLLNKRDLFQSKLRQIHFSVCFPLYQGDNSYTNCLEHLIEKLYLRDKTPGNLYVHATCAVDTTNIRNTFDEIFKYCFPVIVG